MNNKLIEMQEMLMNQMKRLDDDKLMAVSGRGEVLRGNALNQNATTFLKSVNVGMRIIEMSNKYEIQEAKLSKELGVK